MKPRLVVSLTIVLAFSVTTCAFSIELPRTDRGRLHSPTRFLLMFKEPPPAEQTRVLPAFEYIFFKDLMDKGISSLSIRVAEKQHFNELRFACDYPQGYAAYFDDDLTSSWLRLVASPGNGECLILCVMDETAAPKEILADCLSKLKKRQESVGFKQSKFSAETTDDLRQLLLPAKLGTLELGCDKLISEKESGDTHLLQVAVAKPASAKNATLIVVLSGGYANVSFLFDDLQETFSSLKVYDPDPVRYEELKQQLKEADAFGEELKEIERGVRSSQK